MNALETLRKLWDHVFWADARILEALRSAGTSAEAAREYAHILGAEEIWLARLERRPPRTRVWPEEPTDSLVVLGAEIHAGFRRFLDGLTADSMEAPVAYTNTRGQAFTNTAQEILLHTALHGQYHRGKVNLLLRQSGAEPAPVDLIAYLRGVPAATTRPG
jgi:uncharacterized damage-inducible protein DinB